MKGYTGTRQLYSVVSVSVSESVSVSVSVSESANVYTQWLQEMYYIHIYVYIYMCVYIMCMCTICVCVCVCVCVYVCIYIVAVVSGSLLQPRASAAPIIALLPRRAVLRACPSIQQRHLSPLLICLLLLGEPGIDVAEARSGL